MKLLFVHDHRFRKVNDVLYSTGGLNNIVLTRYTNYCDTLVVVARVIEEENVIGRWSQITNPKVRVVGNSTFKCNELEEEIRNCDKMIIRLPSFLGSVAMQINKKYQKPYLIELVGCAWDALWNHGLKGKFIAPIMLYFNKMYVKNAPYVLYVTKEFLQKRYPSNGKTIGCSDVEINELEKTVETNRLKKISSPKSKLVIGTIAALDVKYKGQEYVIRALGVLKMKGIDSFEYWLVGNGSNEYLKKIAERCNVAENVYFLGGMSHEKIFEWLDTIDIYVQPSKQEGLPRALVEAMSRGLPVIGADVGGIPELVSEKYRFNPSNYKSIAEILSNLQEENLINMSIENFGRVADYQKNKLDEKRDEFYREFIMNNE